MISEKLVSIVIPAYNAGRYLQKCLESILRQTYEKLQVIVIDDGSIDNTYQICRVVQQFDSRIELNYQINSGPSAARNLGLQYVKGTYLLFVDADDYLHPGAIAELVEQMEAKQADLACFEWYLIKEEQIVGGYSYSDEETKAIRKQMFDNILTNDFLNGGGFLWNKMWRIDTIRDDAIVLFDIDLKKYEDKLWVLQNLLHCKNVIYIRKKLYYYRLLADSLSHSASSINSARQFFLASDRIVEFVRTSYPLSIKKAEAWSRTYLAGLLFRGIRERCLTEKDIQYSKKYRIYQLPVGWKSMIHWIIAKITIKIYMLVQEAR